MLTDALHHRILTYASMARYTFVSSANLHKTKPTPLMIQLHTFQPSEAYHIKCQLRPL
jgi:hypothetical protein